MVLPAVRKLPKLWSATLSHDGGEHGFAKVSVQLHAVRERRTCGRRGQKWEWCTLGGRVARRMHSKMCAAVHMRRRSTQRTSEQYRAYTRSAPCCTFILIESVIEYVLDMIVGVIFTPFPYGSMDPLLLFSSKICCTTSIDQAASREVARDRFGEGVGV